MAAIAEKVGMPPQSLDRWLSEDGNLSFATVARVADAMDMRVAFLPKRH